MTSTYKKQVLVSLGPVSRFGLATTWEDMLFPRIQQISVKYVLVQEIFFTKYLNCQLSVHDHGFISIVAYKCPRERDYCWWKPSLCIRGNSGLPLT